MKGSLCFPKIEAPVGIKLVNTPRNIKFFKILNKISYPEDNQLIEENQNKIMKNSKIRSLLTNLIMGHS